MKIHNRETAHAWQQRHDDQAPDVGNPAPDFELRDIQGENPVRMSIFAGERPVALVFGSFT